MVSIAARRATPLCLLTAALLAASPVVAQAQQQSCAPPGTSGQCNELGSILMDFQREVKGQPIDVSVRVTIDNNYRNDARYFLFSVRNVSTEERESPVTVTLKSFQTALGEVQTTRTDERAGPNELNLWVDVLDIPVGQPIDLAVRVGVREAGAYYLEALVMPFDRAYHPLKGTNGVELSLFAFTLLAVNQPSGDPGTSVTGNNVLNSLPGLEASFALAGAAGAAVMLRVTGRGRRGSTMLRLFRRP